MDGNSATLIHTKKGNADPNPVWTVDLEAAHEVALIEIQNRYCEDTNDLDNCLGRLSYATVELLDNLDNVVDSKSFGDTTGELLLSLDFNNCVSEFHFCVFATLRTGQNLTPSLFIFRVNTL